MGNIALLIDGGYVNMLLKKHFGEARLDYAQFVKWACGDEKLFRAYYYDCLPYQSSRPADEEREMVSRKQSFLNALVRLNRFVVRLGRLEFRGFGDTGLPIFEQKRVDLQMGIDVATLVFNQRVDAIGIVSGDSDLVPAVDIARNNGVLVKLIHGPKHTYHQDLWDAADDRVEITRAVIDQIVAKK